jgi:PKD repeat protein
MKRNLQKLFFAFGLIIAPVALNAQLSGTFTIGGVSPTFATIQDACDSLNSVGVSGAVIMNIRDGIYLENINLDSVVGASAIHTITFQSQSANSTLVTISSAGVTFYSQCSFLRLKNLTIVSTGNNTVRLDYGTNYLLDGCVLYSASNYGFYMYNYNGNVSNVTIQNSTFTGQYGFYVDVINLNQITLNNVDCNTVSDGGYFYADGTLSNMLVTNSSFNAPSGTGFYAEGSQLTKKIQVSDSYFHGIYEGLYVYSDENIDSVDCHNNTVRGSHDAYPWGSGIYIYSDGPLTHVMTNNNDIDSAGYAGIYIYGDAQTNWVDVSGNDITHSFNYGIYGYSSNDILRNFNIVNNKITGASASPYGVYLYADNGLENITMDNDSIHVYGSYAVYMEGYNGVNNIDITDSYINGDSLSGSCRGLYIESSYNDINDVTIGNSSIYGKNQGVYLYASARVTNSSIINSTAFSKSSQAIYMYGDYNGFDNINLLNSTFTSRTNYGIEAYAYGQMANFNIRNCDIYSNTNYGIYAYSEGGANNVNVRSNNIYAPLNYGMYLYNDYSNVTELHADSNIINTTDYGIYVYQGDYGTYSNLTFNNNTINNYTGNESIYIDISEAGADNIEVNNNILNGGAGIYAYAYTGGLNNMDVLNNTIRVDYTSADGIYLENTGVNVNVKHNSIDTISGTAYYSEGIYIYNDESPFIQSINIDSNKIYNSRYEGIDVEYASNVNIRKNDVKTLSSNNSNYGIYLYNINDGYTNITNNNLYFAHENYGIYAEYYYGLSTNRPFIANNFISGINVGIYAYDFPYTTYANNSISTSQNSNYVVYLDSDIEGTDFINNIINVDSATYNYSSLVYLDNAMDLNVVRNNVYNLDTNITNFAYDLNSATTYNSIYDFRTATGKETGSFYRNVAFVNDTTNLHVLCSETALNAGMSTPLVTMDFDGNARAGVPTIGADEILSTNNIFANSPVYICGNSVTLDAGYSPGSTYSWSTGATSQSIVVSTVGNYTVTVTTPCGVKTDVISVQYLNMPTASFGTNTSFLTGIFTNTSVNANSYLWDFGDGNTSTTTSPTHVYATGNAYTVTLIAYGNCTNDTTTFLVNVSTIGLEEISTINFNMYPNPTDGAFNVVLDNLNAERLEISIINLQGQTMFSTETNNVSGQFIQQMNIETYPAGIYFVRIQADKQTLTGKMIRK